MSGMRWVPRALLLALLVAAAAPAVPAHAHSYADPALRTLLDGVQPALPPAVVVDVQPGVRDALVLANPTAVPLEVVGTDGAPFLRLSRDGVLADVASPDWYTTAVPEGSPPLPPYAAPGAPPRWVRVSAGSTWSEFDPRLRPDVRVPAAVRVAGRSRVVATWSVPLRYGGQPARAEGHVLFAPVRGGLVVAVTGSPTGVTATALQGELPGLFLRAEPGRRVEVAGSDGGPFLRMAGGRVEVAQGSPSWRADRAARGEQVSGSGWRQVGTGSSYTWLDPRLRYPHDEPPEAEVARQVVVQRWAVPVTVDGTPGRLTGTVTWVPRAQALTQVRPEAAARSGGRWWTRAVAGAAVIAALVGVALAQRRRRIAVRPPTVGRAVGDEQSG
jgi:hypothetical protein